MAKANMEIPANLINQIKDLGYNTDDIMGKMVEAGAEVVYNQLMADVPDSFRNSEIMNCLKVTKVYKTPSDDGINCKVAFYGYFYNRDGIRTPAELVVNVMEYGRSNSDSPKRPFVRRSFNKSKKRAYKAMQDKYKAMLKDYPDLAFFGITAEDVYTMWG